MKFDAPRAGSHQKDLIANRNNLSHKQVIALGMDKQEAQMILKLEMQKYHRMQFRELVVLIDQLINYPVQGEKGAEYQVEIQVFWDDPRRPKGNIRVIGSIDDGSFRYAFSPLSSDFIMQPDGSFLGE